MVEKDKLDEGVTVKVLLELEPEGDEDIWTQELKLSEDTRRVPEQVVFAVVVVREVVSIVSEKVTEMVELTETEVSELDGEVEETVGAVVSTVKEVRQLPLNSSPATTGWRDANKVFGK